jgi:hypothetical protein
MQKDNICLQHTNEFLCIDYSSLVAERGFHLVAYVNAQSIADTINSTGKKMRFLERTDAGGEEGSSPSNSLLGSWSATHGQRRRCRQHLGEVLGEVVGRRSQ